MHSFAGCRHNGLLGNLFTALKPGGSLTVSGDVSPQLNSELILAGFVAATSGAAGAYTKPEWSAGTATKLNFKKKATAGAPVQNSSAAAVHIVSGGWGAAAGTDADLVDEDALLDADKLEAAATSADGGCATKKRACKNCSCG